MTERNLSPRSLHDRAQASRWFPAYAFAVLALLCFAAYLVRYPVLGSGNFLSGNLSNYNVWYCGLQAVKERRDPYLVEPIRTCEQNAEPQIHRKPWSVTPMPLPGYTLALLAPVLLLPYTTGKVLWLLLTLAALAFSAWCLTRLTRLPFAPLLAVMAPALFVLQIMYAGIEPFAVAALCAAALALERNRFTFAVVLAAFAMVEPHVGLPAVLALAILVPRARIALAGSLVALALLSVGMLGLATNVEYVRVVLPAQSAAESLYSFYQFGLTHVLWLLGAPAKVATTLGSLSYVATIALGIAVAARMRSGYGRAAAIVLVPVATSLFGGPYVHNHQIAAALPGALLLAVLDARLAWAAAVAVAMLAFPPLYDVRLQEALACFAVVTAIALLFGKWSWPRRLAFGVALAGALAVTMQLDERLPHAAMHETAQPQLIRADMPASAAWGYLLRWSPGAAVDDARTLVVKLPWWFALLALTVSAADLQRGARRKDAMEGSPTAA
ncbi:MAG: hypothetical protein GIW95_10575 [Candidatus Eremiobacteraeota bacterium]|nr:hypothetical protein [Candidatus Eremiobacteraeota bacterium]